MSSMWFKNDDPEKLFSRRCAYAFFLFICLCLFSVLRLSVISSGDTYAAMQKNQSSYRISVAKIRGTVYDRNMIPLTNNRKEKYAAIPPTPGAIMDVPSFLSGEEKDEVLEKLKKNEIAICKPSGKVNSDDIITTDVYFTEQEDFFPTHLIGYTDASGHGVCGIQKAYDAYLFRESGVDALFDVDGKGRMLYGGKPSFQNDLSGILDGVKLTVDIKIQDIINKESKGLNKGAIVVCDAKNGKIRAIKSVPDYKIGKIYDSLNKENSPLLNRAVTAFPVGSVFKPCVAAAAFTSGNNGFLYICTGKTHIIDRDFSCHKHDGHGAVDLSDAISFSCNTFFYNLGIRLGAEKIYNTASLFSFGNKIKIAENMYTDEGYLPKPETLDNDAEIANISIGQGDLMLSPVSMLTLYMSIANGGYYILPSVVEGTVSGGKTAEYESSPKTRVFSTDCAEYLKKALINVVENGTAKEAYSEIISIAGKTATAQTGRYNANKTEITNSWFCGFFPADNPRYTAVVMSDGAANEPVTEIFRRIAEKITEMT